MRTQERLETEIELARQIQKTFMPDSLPSHPAWEMASSWRTARQVGGDFFDIFELPGNRLGVFIADVADKGMPAALFMTLVRTLLRATVRDNHSPAEALGQVHNLLVPDAKNGMFVTLFWGIES